MKVDFGMRVQRWERGLKRTETLGLALFILTFWLPWGFYLGGDPTFFGPFRSELELIFPLAGLGLFAVFFVQYLQGTQGRVSRQQTLLLLGFLGITAFGSIFSSTSETSLLYLILWATGILGASFGSTFVLQGRFKRRLLGLSIVGGVVTAAFFPALGISAQLLAVGSILGVVSALGEKAFPRRLFYLLFYTWVVFESGHLGLIALLLGLYVTAGAWLPRTRDKRAFQDIVLPFLFFLGLIVWGFWQGRFAAAIDWGWLPGFTTDVVAVLFGVGEGQYLPALSQASDVLLRPDQLMLPMSGWLLVFYEKGVLGAAALFGFWLYAGKTNDSKRQPVFQAWLWLLLSLVTIDLLGTENGLLVFLVFLLARPEAFRNTATRSL